MKPLSPDSWSQCRSLFRDHRRLRPTIDATLDGYFDGYGDSVEVLGDEDHNPSIAALRIGTDIVLGGDMSSSHLPEICKSFPVARNLPHWREDFEGALITPENEAWSTAIASATTRKLIYQKRRIYSCTNLDSDYLGSLKESLRPGFQLRRFDETMAGERGINVERAALAYVRLRRFFDGGGISFWILKDGERVAEATSFGVSQDAIEVGVGTGEGFERMGLGTVVSAALLLEAIRLGKDPYWTTTENPRSDGLAQKLGYELQEELDIFGFGD